MRVYGEPVNVQARDDGRPARFVWRGRLYTVRAILEHWVINREWWQEPEGPEGSEAPEPGQPALEFWRVEASAGQGMTADVYELRRDAATDAWTLRRSALTERSASVVQRCPPGGTHCRSSAHTAQTSGGGSGKWLPQVAQTQVPIRAPRPVRR
jgi:hypothetical protein